MKIACTVWSGGKLEDNFKKLPITIMGGGCVSGDSLVALSDGSFKSIQYLVENNIKPEIFAFDEESQKLIKTSVAEVYDSGIQETIKITLESGRYIQGTLDHPVIARSHDARTPKWTHLKDITMKMQLAVPTSLPGFGLYNNKYARLLGMLIGDGSYSKGSVWYASENNELWDYIHTLLPNNYIDIRESFITKKGFLYRSGRISGINQILRDAGIFGQAKTNKRLPSNWQEYNKESLAELLGGLFDTDGTVHIEKNNNPRHQKIIISIVQIAYSMILEIQLALLKFGIHSKIYSYMPKSSYGNTHNIAYNLVIRGKESINNFANNIKLLIPYKQKNINIGIKLLQTHKEKVVKEWLDKGWRFERVKSIEIIGLTHVYDLAVDKYHNFIANGIFVHNTNAKLIQIGTPKTRNHFYDAIDGKESANWTVVKRDWSQCPNLWALSSTMLPDHEDPTHERLRPYSTFVLSLMPKSLKQEFFPTRPDAWTEGSMSVEDFRTQYMLEFVDGAGQFLRKEEVNKLKNGEFDWQDYGKIGETYVAGIDFAGSSSDSADFTHITVLRITPDNIKQKIYSEEMHGIPYPEQIRRIAQLFGGFHPRFRCKSIFADMTGCGYPVVQSLRDEFGLLELKGIIFNSSDTYTNSGMNMKNVMFATIKQEIDCDRFKYPTIDRFLESAGYNKNGFYYKQIGEWSDLECEQKISINKRIEAPTGAHDDVCCADALANFAACIGQRRVAPKPSMGHFGSSFR